MGSLFVDDYDIEGDIEGDARARARAYDELAGAIPTTDLAESRYNEARRSGGLYDSALGAASSSWASGTPRYDARAELDALSRLSDLSRGGLTEADRGMLDSTARHEAMRSRGDREAMLAELEARGMGSSGASLAASMGASEAATDRLSDANAAAMANAQARAYDALSAYGSMGAHRADRSAGMESERLSAIDSWNAAERDRAERLGAANTERRREDTSRYEDAQQREWENRYSTTTAATGSSERDTDRTAEQRNREEDRDSEREGEIISGVSRLGGGALGMAR